MKAWGGNKFGLLGRGPGRHAGEANPLAEFMKSPGPCDVYK